jgi:predicted O-methyltransferase YrrM
MNKITPEFIKEYQHSVQHDLGEPHTGGTNWQHAERIAPVFYEILEIAKPETMLEIGFNAGASALLFLMIDPKIKMDSVDIIPNEKSSIFLNKEYDHYFLFIDSSRIIPDENNLFDYYDLIFIDGDHSEEAVIRDIRNSLKFTPKYLLFDDVRHPSHSYIERIITEDFKDKLEVVKLWEFNDIWEGYSMALCKVKY